MAYYEHKKGGNCPKSKSSNNQRRTEIKESSSKFYRRNEKKTNRATDKGNIRMKIKKKRLEIIVHNLLDVLYDEIMCNETYFKTLEEDIGLSKEEIKELDNEIYQRIVIELGANIWN